MERKRKAATIIVTWNTRFVTLYRVYNNDFTYRGGKREGLDRDESRYSLITLIFRSYRSNELVVVLEKDRTRSG